MGRFPVSAVKWRAVAPQQAWEFIEAPFSMRHLKERENFKDAKRKS